MSAPTKLTVRLPLLPLDCLGGLHQPIATAKVLGGKVEVSAGFGLGTTDLYVAINGKRRLAVDCGPLLKAAIDEALRRWKYKPKEAK